MSFGDTYKEELNSLADNAEGLQAMKREADRLVTSIREKGFDIEHSLETSQDAEIFIRHQPREFDGERINLYEQLLAVSCFIMKEETSLKGARLLKTLRDQGFPKANQYFKGYLQKQDSDYETAASYQRSSDTIAVAKIPEEIWDDIQTNTFLQPIKARTTGVTLHDLQTTITHEMTHAYIQRNTNHGGERQAFNEIDEAAASAVSEILDEEESISVEAYQSSEEGEGLRKKVFVTYLHAFADIAEGKSKVGVVDEIRRNAVEYIQELQQNPGEDSLRPLSVLPEERYDLVYNAVETIARSEKLLLHPLSMLNLVEPRYFEHLRRLEEDLELSIYLAEEEAFPGDSLMEGVRIREDTDFEGLELDEDIEEGMDSLSFGHKGDLETFIENLEELPGNHSDLSDALKSVIEIWHKGDEHLEHLEEKEERLVEKFDSRLDGMKKILEEGSSITPNDLEKRFPEKDLESILKTFLEVHLKIATTGKDVAKEIMNACMKAEKNGLKEMKGRHDEMPLTLEEDIKTIIKSIDELKKICQESIRRFEETEENIKESKKHLGLE